MHQRIKTWIRANRKAYFSRIATEVHTNEKSFCSFFKIKSNRRSFPDTMLLDNNTEITSDLEKVAAFSDHFKSFFTDHSLCYFPTGTPNCEKTLFEVVLSRREVLLELQGLNVNKAMGPDEIPARLLVVECAEEIADSLTFCCRLGCSSVSEKMPTWRRCLRKESGPFS